MTTHLSRRHFLGGLAAVGAHSFKSRRALADSPNDKVQVACIGVRGRGNSVMRSFAADPDCVVTHICDVNQSVREQRGHELKEATGREPKLVNDFRDLLSDESLDALMVATPDHWHALLTIHGCLSGKDVYVEKPASHNIVEGRVAVEASRKCKRIVQVGTQIRSARFLQEAAQFAASGALGKIIYGKSWETSRNSAIHLAMDTPVPPGFDYEIWQGPATERPFNATIVGGAWRWLFDYGTGDLGNDGVHRIDYCRQVMGIEKLPHTVSCAGGKFFFRGDDQEWPDTMVVNFEYPDQVLQYEMLLWSRPKPFGATEGAAIYGENGWMVVTNRSWTAYDSDGKEISSGASSLADAQRDHIRNFLDAVRTRRSDSLNQEIYSGHVSTTMCHAGNIAWRTGKRLRLDPKSETFDDSGANQLRGREHRRGYELPAIS